MWRGNKRADYIRLILSRKDLVLSEFKKVFRADIEWVFIEKTLRAYLEELTTEKSVNSVGEFFDSTTRGL